MLVCGMRIGAHTERQKEPRLIMPTYTEMQLWSGAVPDGKWGPESDRLYRMKLNEQYAVILYEETE